MIASTGSDRAFSSARCFDPGMYKTVGAGIFGHMAPFARLLRHKGHYLTKSSRAILLRRRNYVGFKSDCRQTLSHLLYLINSRPTLFVFNLF
jgi:hypothetical protein